MAYPQQQYKTSVYCHSSERVSICEQLAHIWELSIYQEGYGTEQTLTCPLAPISNDVLSAWTHPFRRSEKQSKDGTGQKFCVITEMWC